MAKINTDPVVYIPAVVQETTPDMTDYKVYRTTLTFQGRVAVLVPVKASEVTVRKGKEGETYTLTLEGWKDFLRNYTKITRELFYEYQRSI